MTDPDIWERHPSYPERPADMTRPRMPTSRLLASLRRPHAWITAVEQAAYDARVVEAEAHPELRAAVVADAKAAWQTPGHDDPRRTQARQALWMALRAWDRGLSGDPRGFERAGAPRP